jgi:Domain of unknown function (DUF4936)
VVSYFIYYRVAPGLESRAKEQTRRLQSLLAESLGVRCRLMTKRGESNLWMEVYEAVINPPAFERAIDAAVRDLQFDQLLAPGSRRNLECFEG